jgi:starch synthase
LHDPFIVHHYSLENITNRSLNKEALIEQFNFPIKDKSIPFFTIISRLDFQKGIDLITDGFVKLKNLEFRLIILGSGSKDIENKCQQLEKDNPEKVRVALRFDHELASRLYSGADMILIPSRFEPCGLTQMIAMHYGCLPIARATGGLKDSIQDGVNGFLFNELSTSSLSATLEKSIRIYKDKKRQWLQMQKNAMKSDFSWERSARAYVKLYLKLLKGKSY